MPLFSRLPAFAENHPNPKFGDRFCDIQRERLFLISSETQQTDRGWLLCIDTSSRAGWLYSPPLTVPMEEMTISGSGEIALKTKLLQSGSYFLVRGKLSSHKLDGVLMVEPTKENPEGGKFNVHGDEIEELAASAGQLPVGRYSNVRFVEDSGDLVGSEMLVFPVNGKLVALVTFYDGYWGEPVFVPLMGKVAKLGRGSSFEIELRFDGREAKYSARLDIDAIIIRRTDMPSAVGTKFPRLTRQDRFFPIAQIEPRIPRAP